MRLAWGMLWAVGVSGAWLLAACDSADACNGHTEAECPTTTGGGAGSGGEGGSVEPLSNQYCDCMLLSCHDAYHDTFGPDSDEPAARAACLQTAAAWPEAGMDVAMGDFVECRIHYCQLGKTDPSVCPDAVGPGACE